MYALLEGEVRGGRPGERDAPLEARFVPIYRTGLEADLLSGILYALKGEVRAHIRYCTGLEADLVSGMHP